MAYVKCSGGVTGEVKKSSHGTYVVTAGVRSIINCGFKPNYVMWHNVGSYFTAYDSSRTGNQCFYSGSSSYFGTYAVGGSSGGNRIYSINDDGFTINKPTTGGATCYWYAAQI